MWNDSPRGEAARVSRRKRQREREGKRGRGNRRTERGRLTTTRRVTDHLSMATKKNKNRIIHFDTKLSLAIKDLSDQFNQPVPFGEGLRII